MKITVLLFQPDPDADPVLADALGSAGIRVCRKKTISGMHHQLSSRFFDAILVDRAVLASYGVSPARHLGKSSSPHTIMVFSRTTDGCSIMTHSISQQASGFVDRDEKAEILSRIEAIVRSALSPATSQAPAVAPAVAIPSASAISPAVEADSSSRPEMPVLEVPLQEKPARLLASLVEAGPAGADLADIARKLWGTIVPDRKKDIQIYVTRVRRALESSFPERYRIRLSGTHYILVDTAA